MTEKNPENTTTTARAPHRPALPLIAWAALPLTLGMVFAQTGTATDQAQAQRVQPAQPGQRGTQSGQQEGQQNQTPGGQTQRQTSGTNYADVFLQKLAAQLGISLDRLKTAATAAATGTIDQGVKAGDFTADQATFMKQNAAQNPFAMMGGRGGPGGRGGHDHGGPGQMGMGGQMGGTGDAGGMRFGGGQAVGAAVAKALGLTEQQLQTELQAGKTIEQLAQARGVSTAALHTAAVNAFRTALAAEVTAGRLTQAQADQMIQQAQADANFGLNLGGPGRGRGMGGRGGFHNHQDSAQTSPADEAGMSTETSTSGI